MTKARDLANIANGVPNSLITLDANEIPNLDTAKITTGTFADARISQSSVSQHATSFDDSKIQQDLMVLALQQATDANKAAYSLSNSFVEQFEDSSGIDVLTNALRNASEYVSSMSTTTTTYPANTNIFNSSPFTSSASYTSSSGTAANGFDGNGTSSHGNLLMSGIIGFPQYSQIDFGSGNAYVINKYGIKSYTDGNGPYFGSHTFQGSNDGSTYTTLRSHSGALSTYSAYAEYTFTNTTAYRYYKINLTDNAGGYANEVVWYDTSGFNTNGTDISSTVLSATGNVTSVSKTAPATVSKMGIVVLYKNNTGTATLNTDLIAQVSANNGTDYTTVTLTPRGTFSTGINIAVANNVTVTSGTSCKYKISFANQSSGTKETQVHGVGLIY